MGRTNLNPRFWGPHVWKTIHAFAVGFPDEPTKEEVNALVNFFDGLRYLIPCKSCRDHYTQNYQNLPPMPVYSKKDLIRWTYDLHTSVNNMLNKQTYSYEKFIKEYELEKKDISGEYDIEVEKTLPKNKNEKMKKNKKGVKVFIIVLTSVLLA